MLPYYLALGVTRSEIDISTPNDLKPYEEAHKIQIMEKDSLNWYSGMYTMNGVLTAIDKAFSGRNSKMEYIEQPLLAELNLSEEERYERKLKKALAFEEQWAAAASYLPESI